MTRPIATLIAASAVTGVTGATPQGPSTFRSTVNLVPVYATVTTRDGTPATGLRKDDFTVTDNGTRREIVAFSAQAQPISVYVILDLSGSMGRTLPLVRDAAGLFLDGLLAGDRVTVGTLWPGNLVAGPYR